MGFVCPRCQKELSDKSALRTHIEGVHEKKRHKCDQCEKDFASRGALRNHKHTKHEGKKIMQKQCPHCNNSFRAGGNYNQHLLTHESLKPFLCPFCSSYAAKELACLKQHIDSIHFKCRWFCLMGGCNNSETVASSMRRHLKKKHSMSSNLVNHMEQRRTAATPSSLTPVRGKLPSMPTGNDPREASTSLRQQSAQQFTVKFEDVDNQTKLRSLLNRLELIATSTSSDSSSSDDDSSDDSSDQSDASNDKSDEAEDANESDSEDSALCLVEEEMNKRRRLTWHNPDAMGSSSDDDDNDDIDDNDNDNDDKKSNSKSSSSSSSSSSSKKEEAKEEEEASSSSSGPPPRRIDVKPRKVVWIPTGQSSSRGIDINRLQQEPPDALEPYNNWLRDREQQQQEQEQE